jgi:hypothetical protein
MRALNPDLDTFAITVDFTQGTGSRADALFKLGEIRSPRQIEKYEPPWRVRNSYFHKKYRWYAIQVDERDLLFWIYQRGRRDSRPPYTNPQ